MGCRGKTLGPRIDWPSLRALIDSAHSLTDDVSPGDILYTLDSCYAGVATLAKTQWRPQVSQVARYHTDRDTEMHNLAHCQVPFEYFDP
jgi:hypothetical protein